MKNTLLILIMAMMLFPSMGSAKNKGCGFKGSVNGTKLRSFHCEISQAGTRPYMLFGFRYRGNNYMADLNGVQAFPGRTQMRISIMKMRGRRMVKSFRASASQKVLKDRKVRQVYGFFGGFTARSRDGESISIRGIFAWKVDQFPKQDKQGQLSYRFGKLRLGPAQAKIKSWNNGYQINKMILVRGGETVTLTVQFPSDRPGSYRGGKCYARIMHFKIGAKRRMKSRFLSGNDIRVRIINNRGRKTIYFTGYLKGKNERVRLAGKFIE